MEDELTINDEANSFIIGRMINRKVSSSNSDLEAIKKDKISVTPLSLNLTNEEILKNI